MKNHAASPMKRAGRLRVESLETRLAPAVRLDIVALHEFGHSLGLNHDANSSVVSIMDPYYNANYDINYFLSGQDPAVALLQAKFANVNTSAWKDSLDPQPGNGAVDVTYSFAKDGAKMDGAKNTSSLFSLLNAQLGSEAAWKAVFTEALDRWEAVSGGKLNFINKGNETQAYNFGVAGAAQNDARFGDIRIGAHKMPGPTLAHAYFPPPNGGTAAGDAHFDSMESWALADGGASSGGGNGGGGKLTHGHGHSHHLELPGDSHGNEPETPVDIGKILGALDPRVQETPQPTPSAPALVGTPGQVVTSSPTTVNMEHGLALVSHAISTQETATTSAPDVVPQAGVDFTTTGVSAEFVPPIANGPTTMSEMVEPSVSARDASPARSFSEEVGVLAVAPNARMFGAFAVVAAVGFQGYVREKEERKVRRGPAMN